MSKISLERSVRILLLFVLLIVVLYYAKGFLIPVAFGAILAMLFLPLARWLEDKGINRGFSALISILVLLLAVAGVISVLGWQMNNLMENFSQIEKNISRIIQQIHQFVQTTFGISAPKQEKMMEEQSSSMLKTIASDVPSMISQTLVNIVLVIVYIFLFLYYRIHIRKFILKLVPAAKQEQTERIIHQSTRVSFQYLWGLSQMIIGLWIMYSIGFSIIGVKNPVFFAVLCGTLEIVPFVGNITGTLITILVSLGEGADTGMIVGIIITYGLIQFIQTYLLEPLVVGNEVHINPMAIIMVLVAGEMIWGIPGMVLSIPILGMVKVICDNVEPLKPYGFLIGDTRKGESENWFQKLKKRLVKK